MRRLAAALAGALALCALTVHAQTPALVVGSGNFFSPIVGSLERAVRFYRDGLGLEVTGEPSNADTNAALRNMFGLPDARIRWQIARVPNVRGGVEIVEIKPPAPAMVRRIQDPGAVTLALAGPDLDAALKRARNAGAPVVSRNGAPVTIGTARGVLLRDPDGHFVQLVQANPEVRVRITVDDAEKALRLYRDGLGLQQIALTEFMSERGILDLSGLSSGQYRIARTQVPGSGLVIEFIEFKDVDRKTIDADIHNPGSTRMQLQVRDVDAAIAVFKSAGGSVVSTGGATVGLPGRGGATTKTAIVRDPNNLFVVLIETRPQ